MAHTDRHLMIGVVRGGTGTAAQIPGVEVAGKTGTAELKSACTPSSESTESSESGKESSCAGENEASNTDAWFAAFAPAYSPKLVVCVMLVKDGAGGATAAPVAREILEAGLKAADLDVELGGGRLRRDRWDRRSSARAGGCRARRL